MYGIEWQNYEHDPLTIDQVRDQFPGGFRIIRIDHGIAEITDGDAKHGWFADFRPVVGLVALKPLRTLKRFHRKRLGQRFNRLQEKLSLYLHLHGSQIRHLSVINR